MLTLKDYLDCSTGLHPSIIGGFSGLCAFMGVAATFVSSTLVKQFGILKVLSPSFCFTMECENFIYMNVFVKKINIEKRAFSNPGWGSWVGVSSFTS